MLEVASILLLRRSVGVADADGRKEINVTILERS